MIIIITIIQNLKTKIILNFKLKLQNKFLIHIQIKIQKKNYTIKYEIKIKLIIVCLIFMLFQEIIKIIVN